MLVALLAGLLTGFLGSIPLAGPVALLVAREGLAGRVRRGRGVALGSALGETLHALIGLLGLGRLLTQSPSALSFGRLGVGLLIIVVGALAWRHPPDFGTARRSAPVSENARSAFALGFGMTAFNPTLLVTWGTVGALLRLQGWVQSTPEVLACTLGAGLGVAAWFWPATGWIASWSEDRTPPTLRRLHRGVAGALVILGVVLLLPTSWTRLGALA
ncbi:MAG: LysE family transporter [Acidobacteriota bacterium]